MPAAVYSPPALNTMRNYSGAQQRFLGLGNAFLIFFPALQHLDSLFERGCAAVPHFKPNDRVHDTPNNPPSP